MNIVFLKDGKYRDNDLIIVTPDCVKSKKEFTVTEGFGDTMIDAKRAKRVEKEALEAPKTLEDIKDMGKPELLTYAEIMKIDLGGASKKDEILAVVEKTFE